MKKGFLILQIDGLSYERLKEAINKGQAPFLKYLLKNQKFKLEKMYCGLPPLRTQTGIMYGKHQDIPELTWFNKRKVQFASLIDIENVKEIEKKWSNGILKEGVSIGTVFSGGSKERFGSVSNLNLSFFLKYFPKYKIGFYLITAPFALLVDFGVSLLTKLKRGAVFEGIFIEKISRHHALDLAERKIKKGCPFLYVNFTGYDQRAHRFGKKSILAKNAIKGIDKKIKKIYNLIKESKTVDYDLFIISDHGQAESIPFKDYFGYALKDIIEKNLKIEATEGKEFQKRITVEQIERMVNDIPWLRKTSWPFRVIAKRYYVRSRSLFVPIEVVLIFQGDLAHIYFNIKKERVLYKEIEKTYPKFLNSLLSHRGIKLLVVSSEKGIKILGKKGEISLNQEEKLTGKDPLSGAFDRNFTLDSIRKLAGMRNSGDVIILSSKINGKMINFKDQFSCHAGIEKEEQEIFILSPSSCKEKFEGIKDPRGLYKFFIKYLK